MVLRMMYAFAPYSSHLFNLSVLGDPSFRSSIGGCASLLRVSYTNTNLFVFIVSSRATRIRTLHSITRPPRQQSEQTCCSTFLEQNRSVPRGSSKALLTFEYPCDPTVHALNDVIKLPSLDYRSTTILLCYEALHMAKGG